MKFITTILVVAAAYSGGAFADTQGGADQLRPTTAPVQHAPTYKELAKEVAASFSKSRSGETASPGKDLNSAWKPFEVKYAP